MPFSIHIACPIKFLQGLHGVEIIADDVLGLGYGGVDEEP